MLMVAGEYFSDDLVPLPMNEETRPGQQQEITFEHMQSLICLPRR